MDEKKSFELNDEMLSEVSGGAGNGTKHSIGDNVRIRCGNRDCSKFGGYSTAVITKMIDEEHGFIKMNCCGYEPIHGSIKLSSL